MYKSKIHVKHGLLVLYLFIYICFSLSYSSDAFDLQFGVVIFRLRAGFDATDSEGKAKGEAKETPLQYYVSVLHVHVHYFSKPLWLIIFLSQSLLL